MVPSKSSPRGAGDCLPTDTFAVVDASVTTRNPAGKQPLTSGPRSFLPPGLGNCPELWIDYKCVDHVAGSPPGRPSRRTTVAFVSIGVALVVIASSLLVTACGVSATSTPAARPLYEVDVATVPGLGRILVDGAGYTLYIYQFDQQGSSRCYLLCARDWPPLDLPRGVIHPLAGRGVTPSLLGVTRRSNGTMQVTYNHWPLYLYRDDGQPGEVAGQAEDMGAWYVMSVGGTVDRNSLPGS